jgi:hypothetical protein
LMFFTDVFFARCPQVSTLFSEEVTKCFSKSSMLDVFHWCLLRQVSSNFQHFFERGDKCRVYLMFSVDVFFDRCPQIFNFFRKRWQKCFSARVYLMFSIDVISTGVFKFSAFFSEEVSNVEYARCFSLMSFSTDGLKFQNFFLKEGTKCFSKSSR